jgi:hypothetical protein
LGANTGALIVQEYKDFFEVINKGRVDNNLPALPLVVKQRTKIHGQVDISSTILNNGSLSREEIRAEAGKPSNNGNGQLDPDKSIMVPDYCRPLQRHSYQSLRLPLSASGVMLNR